MVLGLGSGSTAAHAIEALGERLRTEALKVRGVPTSRRSRELAVELNIPLVELDDVRHIDLTIDGADEVNPALDLIKGGGGALVREKLVASASRALTIICDDSKLHAQLGAFPLPVAVFPFGWQSTRDRLQALCPNITLRVLKDSPETAFCTDDGLYILDLHMETIADPATTERLLKHTVGVAEVGLFVGLATCVVVGFADGHVEEHIRD